MQPVLDERPNVIFILTDDQEVSHTDVLQKMRSVCQQQVKEVKGNSAPLVERLPYYVKS